MAIGIAALMGLATKVGNLTSNTLGETYAVTANYENIGGLKPRAPVKSSGVVVGRIDNIKFDTKVYQAVVTLKIDKRYPFPKDTFANISLDFSPTSKPSQPSGISPLAQVCVLAVLLKSSATTLSTGK